MLFPLLIISFPLLLLPIMFGTHCPPIFIWPSGHTHYPNEFMIIPGGQSLQFPIESGGWPVDMHTQTPLNPDGVWPGGQLQVPSALGRRPVLMHTQNPLGPIVWPKGHWLQFPFKSGGEPLGQTQIPLTSDNPGLHTHWPLIRTLWILHTQTPPTSISFGGQLTWPWKHGWKILCTSVYYGE